MAVTAQHSAQLLDYPTVSDSCPTDALSVARLGRGSEFDPGEGVSRRGEGSGAYAPAVNSENLPSGPQASPSDPPTALPDPTPAILVCRGVTSTGTPCKQVHGLGPTGLCLQHDPDRAEERQKPRPRSRMKKVTRGPFVLPDELPCGGKLETLEHCGLWAAWLVRLTVLGELDAGAAREANKAILTLRWALQDKTRALEQRIKELEKRLTQALETRGA